MKRLSKRKQFEKLRNQRSQEIIKRNKIMNEEKELTPDEEETPVNPDKEDAPISPEEEPDAPSPKSEE